MVLYKQDEWISVMETKNLAMNIVTLYKEI